jgi:hypothetical protein
LIAWIILLIAGGFAALALAGMIAAPFQGYRDVVNAQSQADIARAAARIQELNAESAATQARLEAPARAEGLMRVLTGLAGGLVLIGLGLGAGLTLHGWGGYKRQTAYATLTDKALAVVYDLGGSVKIYANRVEVEVPQRTEFTQSQLMAPSTLPMPARHVRAEQMRAHLEQMEMRAE